MKNFALRLYPNEAEALERLAMIKDKSQNDIINDLIGRAYCEADELTTLNPITHRIKSEELSRDYYFFEGLFMKLAEIPDDGEPLQEYRREDLEAIAQKDRRKIPELYRAANFSLEAARKEFNEHQDFFLEHPEECDKKERLIEQLDKAIKDLEEIYNESADDQASY